ncbi:MAG: hypothetical protein D6816_18355 [Bacteroidetes bacterium]|nr:MAG: hypothetical protein D6816_18355 [Bacteroidota bacterium]
MFSLSTTQTHGLTVIANLPDHRLILTFIARLAQNSPVRVLVGGNRFDAHQLARQVRQFTTKVDDTLARIEQARPFTCFQTLSLLAHTPPTAPFIALDLLTTFYDDNITNSESIRLTENAIHHLQRLSQQTPVLVTLRPPPNPARATLSQRLYAAADYLYIHKTPDTPHQLTLSAIG